MRRRAAGEGRRPTPATNADSGGTSPRRAGTGATAGSPAAPRPTSSGGVPTAHPTASAAPAVAAAAVAQSRRLARRWFIVALTTKSRRAWPARPRSRRTRPNDTPPGPRAHRPPPGRRRRLPPTRNRFESRRSTILAPRRGAGRTQWRRVGRSAALQRHGGRGRLERLDRADGRGAEGVVAQQFQGGRRGPPPVGFPSPQRVRVRASRFSSSEAAGFALSPAAVKTSPKLSNGRTGVVACSPGPPAFGRRSTRSSRPRTARRAARSAAAQTLSLVDGVQVQLGLFVGDAKPERPAVQADEKVRRRRRGRASPSPPAGGSLRLGEGSIARQLTAPHRRWRSSASSPAATAFRIDSRHTPASARRRAPAGRAP